MFKPSIKIKKQHSKAIYEKCKILIEPKNTVLCRDVILEAPCTLSGCNFNLPLSVGAHTHINLNGLIQNCTIGRYCAIAQNVKIGNGNHPTNWLSVNACQYIEGFHEYNIIYNNKIKVKNFECFKHTKIGNDVWIGANAFIKDGVNIGDGAIIGANSVVTHDVEPYSIVGGVPAKTIRYRFSKEIIKELLELKWWEYDIADFGDVDFDNIELAIKQLKEKLPQLKKYQPKLITSNDLLAITSEKKILFGLFQTIKSFDCKTKYFCGKKYYEKEI